MQIVPWGVQKVLKWVKYNYKDPEIFITGCGLADDGNSLDDHQRINFIDVSKGQFNFD